MLRLVQAGAGCAEPEVTSCDEPPRGDEHKCVVWGALRKSEGGSGWEGKGQWATPTCSWGYCKVANGRGRAVDLCPWLLLVRCMLIVRRQRRRRRRQECFARCCVRRREHPAPPPAPRSIESHPNDSVQSRSIDRGPSSHSRLIDRSGPNKKDVVKSAAKPIKIQAGPGNDNNIKGSPLCLTLAHSLASATQTAKPGTRRPCAYEPVKHTTRTFSSRPEYPAGPTRCKPIRFCVDEDKASVTAAELDWPPNILEPPIHHLWCVSD